jgi:UrcA family protein
MHCQSRSPKYEFSIRTSSSEPALPPKRQKETPMNTSIAAVLIFSFGSLTSAASATELAAAPQRTIQFADLNVARSEGAAVLYQRISNAARVVCAAYESRLPAQRARARRCVNEAVARAVVDVNAAALTRHHATKSTRTIRIAKRP